MENVNAETINDEKGKKHLFNDETYELLINAQNEIFEKTDIRISLRKLLSVIIDSGNINQVKETFIEKLT